MSILLIQPFQVQALSSEQLPLGTVVKRKFSVCVNVLHSLEEDGLLFTFSCVEDAVKWLQVDLFRRMLDPSAKSVGSVTLTWTVAVNAEFRLPSTEEKQATHVFF